MTVIIIIIKYRRLSWSRMIHISSCCNVFLGFHHSAACVVFWGSWIWQLCCFAVMAFYLQYITAVKCIWESSCCAVQGTAVIGISRQVIKRWFRARFPGFCFVFFWSSTHLQHRVHLITRSHTIKILLIMLTNVYSLSCWATQEIFVLKVEY